MARTTSIFYNMTAYRDLVPESSRYHLDQIEELHVLPRALKERFAKISADTKSLPSVEISMEELFIILNFCLSDLEKFQPHIILKNLRKVLKKYCGIEIVPPGNLVFIKTTDKLRITPIYNLDNDTDIVTARQNIGNKTMGSMVATRLQRANTKINNFNIGLHIFEALYLVTNEQPLNNEQRLFLNNFIEEKLLPDNGKVYLRCCFSMLIDKKPFVTDLSADKAHLKPISNPTLLNEFLSIIAKLGAMCYDKLTFDSAPYRKELLTLYSTEKERYQLSVRAQNGANTGLLSFISSNDEDAYKSLIYLEKIIPTHTLYGAKNSEIQAYKERLTNILKEHRFVDQLNLRFASGNQSIYIADIPVENANLYVCLNSDILEKHNWNFAITLNNQSRALQYPEKTKTFIELNQDSRRLLAKGLNQSNGVKPTDVLANIITGNLEYRLLVEGFLGLIDEKEIQKAFIWLLQWFQNIHRANDSTMYDLRKPLSRMGQVISIFVFLRPEYLNQNQEQLIRTLPYFKDYALLKLSAIKNFKNVSKEDLYSYIFQGFVNSAPSYTQNIRAKGNNVLILHQYAWNLFVQYFDENPQNFNTIVKGFSSTNERFSFEDVFSSIKCYKNLALSSFLPNMIKLSDEGQREINSVISYIKKQQKSFLMYINGGSSNTNNDLVYRIYEYAMNDYDTMPQSLGVFKDQLLSNGAMSYENTRRLFNLNLVSRTDCINILYQCAKNLKLYMYPNPDFETYETVISAYDNIIFSEIAITSSGEYEDVIVPFRLALNAATSFQSLNNLFKFFTKIITDDQTLTAQEKTNILSYCQIITDLKINKGGSSNLGSGLSKFEFTETNKQRLLSYLSVIMATSDFSKTMHNITAINTRLKDHFLDSILTKKQVTSRFGTTSFGIPGVSKNSDPTKLDKNLIERMVKETAEVQKVLAPIFSDDPDTTTTTQINITDHDNVANLGELSSFTPSDDVVATKENENDNTDIFTDDGSIKGSAIFELLPENCQQLIMRLLQIGDFSANDFRKLCLEAGMMPDGALEIINNWALDQFDCTLIEEDEPMFFDRELLNDLFH